MNLSARARHLRALRLRTCTPPACCASTRARWMIEGPPLLPLCPGASPRGSQLKPRQGSARSPQSDCSPSHHTAPCTHSSPAVPPRTSSSSWCLPQHRPTGNPSCLIQAGRRPEAPSLRHVHSPHRVNTHTLLPSSSQFGPGCSCRRLTPGQGAHLYLRPLLGPCPTTLPRRHA